MLAMTAPAQYNTITYLIRSGIAYLPNFLSKFIKKIVHKIKISFQNVYSDAYCKKHKLLQYIIKHHALIIVIVYAFVKLFFLSIKQRKQPILPSTSSL